jgi:hypothetical protein
MFGLLIPGRRCLIDPEPMSVPGTDVPNQYVFSFMALPVFTHIIIFLVPGSYLPPNTTANIYIQSPISQESNLLGEIFKSELPKARIRVGIEIAAKKVILVV